MPSAHDNNVANILSLSGLRDVRDELRVPYPGQRVPGAPSRHKELSQGQGARAAGQEDTSAHQTSDLARAQTALRHAQGMHRLDNTVNIMGEFSPKITLFRKN